MSALRKKFKIPNIAQGSAASRFIDFLHRNHALSEKVDKGGHVCKHVVISFEGNYDAEVVVFANDTVVVSASPKIDQAAFGQIAEEIETIAHRSTSRITGIRTAVVSRADELVVFTKSVNLTDEVNRMVAVILSDTANEIVLREKLRALGFNGSPLDEGVPEKVKRIEDRGEWVYRKDDIKSVRVLRNKIAHDGSLPSAGQAKVAVAVTEDFVHQA